MRMEKRNLDFVELKLQKLIEQNVPSKRDIIKLKKKVISTKNELEFDFNFNRKKTRMCEGPFRKGTEILKYFPGHGMYKGKVTRIPSHKNEFYRVKYCDEDDEDLSLEEMRQHANFLVYLKNVESEDIAEENHFFNTTNHISNASTVTNDDIENKKKDDNKDDDEDGNEDGNEEEKTKKREKKVVLSLLIETLKNLKESAEKSLGDGDCKILTMQLKDNMPFFKDTWEGLQNAEMEVDGKPRAKLIP